jgi:replicative DNA helicase
MSIPIMADYGQEHDDPASEPVAHAERAVLGAMMLANEVISEVTQVLQPAHMLLARHREIMAAIVELDGRGDPVDAVSVIGELERAGRLRQSGGAPYLFELIQGVYTSDSAAYHARIVRDAATKRAAARLGVRIQQVAATAGDTDDLALGIDAVMGDYLLEAEQGAVELQPLCTGSLVDDVLATWGTPPASAMTTGIRDVDHWLNVRAGSLVVVAARAGVGKSTLAQQIARHYVFDRAEAVAYFSLEMTRDELATRDLAALARVRVDSAVGKTELTGAQCDKLRQAAQKLNTASTYYVDDATNVDAAYVRSRARSLRRQYGGIGLVVVDYLQLMRHPERDRDDLSIGETTRQLKLLAKELGTIVILVAQLNRESEHRTGGVPKPSDLRGSGSIEQDADAILLIHDVARDDDAHAGEIDLHFGKQRHGATGPRVTMADLRDRALFGDLAQGDDR